MYNDRILIKLPLLVMKFLGASVDSLSRRDLLKLGAATGLSMTLNPMAEASTGLTSYSFHYDHILGTSLDVWLYSTDRSSGEQAEIISLDEIERLRKIFSLYDSGSELSLLNQSSAWHNVSNDLKAVLDLYDRWMNLSHGACNPQLGELKRIWSEAEKTNAIPDADTLKRIAEEIRFRPWRFDEHHALVQRTSRYSLDLNAGAKGYIIGQVARKIQEQCPHLRAGLVNLGGDMVSWGDFAWPIGIQNPHAPEENSPPLGAIPLRNRAVATSGGYQRFYSVQGQKFSHLIDPRTGQPAEEIASATVIADESMTANLLATTLAVLSPAEGLRWIESFPRVSCILVTKAGQILTSAGTDFVFYESESSCQEKKPKPWPEGFQTTISFELPRIASGGKGYRRPYVAIWIEDDAGKPVRTLAVWGNQPKYLKDLTDWWQFAKNDKILINTVTRATRGPGRYEVVWDGKDDKGNPVGQGTFTVKIEVHREHGKHLRQSGKIDCKGEPAQLKIEKNDEAGETNVSYGKKKS